MMFSIERVSDLDELTWQEKQVPLPEGSEDWGEE